MTQKSLRFFALFLFLMSSVLTSPETWAANRAREDRLSEFEFVEPELTPQDVAELEATIAAEKDEALQKKLFEEATAAAPKLQTLVQSQSEPVVIEIFQKAKSIGKQFLTVRVNQRLRYAFAVSAGGHGRSTPKGEFSAIKHLWRHMSSSYPSKGENNMDHVTYFKPLYGFHSTTFSAYSKLGKADSHGCVRLGRPQARAVFTLIKAYGGARIISYGEKEPWDGDVRELRKMLARDLNFIQDMLNEKNKGDVPFSEEQYYLYLTGKYTKSQVDEMAKRKGIREILEIDDGRDRVPGSVRLVNVLR